MLLFSKEIVKLYISFAVRIRFLRIGIKYLGPMYIYLFMVTNLRYQDKDIKCIMYSRLNASAIMSEIYFDKNISVVHV